MAWPLGKPLSQEMKKKMQGPRPALNNNVHARKRGVAPPTMSRHPLYQLYYQMIKKCYDPNHIKFKFFGGRGIKVCKRWQEPDGVGFQNFLSDVGERPTNHNFERIDHEKDFEPTNYTWKMPAYRCLSKV